MTDFPEPPPRRNDLPPIPPPPPLQAASPYQPLSDMNPQPLVSREEAIKALQVPAIIMIVIAALAILKNLVGLLLAPSYFFDAMEPFLRQMGQGTPEMDTLIEQMQGQAEMGHSIFSIVYNLFLTGAYGVIILGATKMMKAQSYGLALTASIISSIPCIGPCCCLGMIPGIWAMIVLFKPHIKAAFE